MECKPDSQPDSRSDSRIPVVFARIEDARPGDSLLVEGEAAVPVGVVVARFAVRAAEGHAPGCVCCVPRSAAAEALRRLFIAHEQGHWGAPSRVIACEWSEAGRQIVLQALREDLFAAARFRPGGDPG